jgi:hypothetical protein
LIATRSSSDALGNTTSVPTSPSVHVVVLVVSGAVSMSLG